jgi:hypothetical protein
MAFPTGIRSLAGYEMPLGDKLLQVFDRTGPTSYVQFVSPSTGGDKLNAADLSRGGFDDVIVGIDTTGQITAHVVMNLGGNANAVPSVLIMYRSIVTATLGGQSQTAGTQIAAATNLAAFSWRFLAVTV